jgi:hypothetical protein
MDERFGKGHVVTCHDCGAHFVLHVDQHTSSDCIRNLRVAVGAAAQMLAAGSDEIMNGGDLRFWAMGADSIARQLRELLGPTAAAQ